MTTASPFPLPVPAPLLDCLGGLGHVVYYPNPGNLGDELIAASTVLLFEKLGVSYEIYQEGKDYGDSYALVYGGGGVMVPEWDRLPGLCSLFSEPGISRCVILPHSMRECDELLDVMDHRFTVFCREEKSYVYCRSRNQTAQFHLVDDMAFYTSAAQLPGREEMFARLPQPNWFHRLAENLGMSLGKNKMLSRFYRKTYKRLERHFPRCLSLSRDGRRIAFFLRRDQEANGSLRRLIPGGGIRNVDISRYGGSDCRWHELNLLGVAQLLSVLSRTDIVVTDRLHVSIAAAMLGKECIMIDNSYQKLSGVYRQSMGRFQGITLCCTAEETVQALHALLPMPE